MVKRTSGSLSVDADDPAAGAGARRRLTVRYVLAALLLAATVGTLVIVLGNRDGDAPPSSSASGPFAPVYEGLEERRVRAGVPTMAESDGTDDHADLEIYARGEQVEVPANIGIDPARPPNEMAGLHTHDTSGTIHKKAGTRSTLGQFFAVRGVPFSPRELGPFANRGRERVRMWVDRESSKGYGDLGLADGERIVITYGAPNQLPVGTVQK